MSTIIATIAVAQVEFIATYNADSVMVSRILYDQYNAMHNIPDKRKAITTTNHNYI